METAISSSTCLGKAWKEQKRTHTYRARIGRFLLVPRCTQHNASIGRSLVVQACCGVQIGRLLVVPRCINVCNQARKTSALRKAYCTHDRHCQYPSPAIHPLYDPSLRVSIRHFSLLVSIHSGSESHSNFFFSD